MITINIAKDYTKSPGGRFIQDGEHSGEDFRENHLLPKYNEAKSKKQKLIVNLDGGYGYPTSFLEEAFGGLARELCDKEILNIKIISDEEPELIERIKKYITDGLKPNQPFAER
jgi:hypothetical protein